MSRYDTRERFKRGVRYEITRAASRKRYYRYPRSRDVQYLGRANTEFGTVFLFLDDSRLRGRKGAGKV
jgi:hypothetical protein